MEPRIIEIKTSTSASPNEKKTTGRLPVLAGPTIWYALAGLSVLLSLYLFMIARFGDESSRHEVALFIGLWAPMFGIIGIRAEIMELREDFHRRKGR